MGEKKFKMLIGADAKEFNDTMKRVKQDMRGVGTESVAMGNVIADVFRDVTRNIVNYFMEAKAAALAMPDGINASVDAAKELQEEAKTLKILLGSMMMKNGFEEWLQKWRKAAVALSSAEFSMLEKINALFFSDAKAQEMYDWVDAQGAALNAKLAAQQKQADFGKMIAADFAKMAKEGQAELTRQGREAEKAAQKRTEALKAEKKAFEESVAEMMRYNYELAKMDELNRKAAAAMEAKMVTFGSTMQAGGDTEKLAAFVSLLKDQNNQLAISQDLLNFIGTAFNDMFITALNSGADFFEQMGLWLENFIKRMLAAAATAALLSALSGGSSTFLSAFKGLIGLTKMAHGGIVDKPTNVQVGEAGPEAIIPLHKLSSLTGGGNLTARISGRDLLILLDREQSFKKRVYG